MPHDQKAKRKPDEDPKKIPRSPEEGSIKSCQKGKEAYLMQILPIL